MREGLLSPIAVGGSGSGTASLTSSSFRLRALLGALMGAHNGLHRLRPNHLVSGLPESLLEDIKVRGCECSRRGVALLSNQAVPRDNCTTCLFVYVNALKLREDLFKKCSQWNGEAV